MSDYNWSNIDGVLGHIYKTFAHREYKWVRTNVPITQKDFLSFNGKENESLSRLTPFNEQ